MATWTWLIADLRSNAILDEVPLSHVSFDKPLNASGTFRARWNLSKSPSTTRRDPYDLTTPAKRAIYAVRDNRPVWGGILWTSEYDSTSATVQLGAADWWSYFDHRRILPVLPANPSTSYVAQTSVTATGVEQNAMGRGLIQAAQAHTAGNILVEFDASSSGINRDRTWYGYGLAEVGEELRRLSSLIDGPDMVFDVASSSTGRPRRLFRQGTPRLQQDGAPWVFEHGGAVVSYQWPRDGARMATRPFATGKGIDAGTPIAVAEDTTAYDDGYPLLEHERSYSSVETPSVLESHVDADLDAVRRPVVLCRVVVQSTRDLRVDEIRQGDDGRLVIPAGDPFHRYGYDGSVRVNNISFSVSEASETVTLTLAPVLEG